MFAVKSDIGSIFCFFSCYRRANTFMGHSSSEQRLCSVRFILVVLGLCLVLYIVRPPRLWHSSTLLASCPPCSCDCSRDSILSLPLGLFIFLYNLPFTKSTCI